MMLKKDEEGGRRSKSLYFLSFEFSYDKYYHCHCQVDIGEVEDGKSVECDDEISDSGVEYSVDNVASNACEKKYGCECVDGFVSVCYDEVDGHSYGDCYDNPYRNRC